MDNFLNEFAMSFSDAEFIFPCVLCLTIGYALLFKKSYGRFFEILSKNDTKHQMNPREHSNFAGGITLALGVWFLLATINRYANFIGLSVFLAIYLLLMPITAFLILHFFKKRANKTKRMDGDVL